MESVYNYQRVILNAFTEVVNRVSKVENYRKSIEIKKQQLESLGPPSMPPANFFRVPASNPSTWKCYWPSVTYWRREWP